MEPFFRLLKDFHQKKKYSYRRRRYKDYFISKLNDCETENAETQVWLDFSLDCKYIPIEEYNQLTAKTMR
ncbi:MAG: four helix bundle protein [Chitinophagaceae bacterium]|nr:four helix bundle protein [Chitinophagaceae bacterium]